MTSLSALAAQSRLAAQADQLKREAETLRQEIDADRAAHAPDPEANPDPEAGAKAAGLAAIDARRQAVQSAATAMGGPACSCA